MTFSITILSIMALDTHRRVILSVIYAVLFMLCVSNKPFMLSVVMLNGIMLRVIMLNVVMLSV
jgi:hypothetical protein